MKGYENAVDILTTIFLIVAGVCGILVAILDFIGADFENGPWQWLKGPLPLILLTVALLALALGLERLIRFQQIDRKLDQTIEIVTRLESKMDGAGIEFLDMRWSFPQHVTKRAKTASKFILDTNLNQEILRSSTTSPQEEYRKIRDKRVLSDELTFRRVEVIFNKSHLETVIRRLLIFEGMTFIFDTMKHLPRQFLSYI